MASASLEASLDLLERMRCHVFLFAQRADVWGFLPSWALVMVVVCCVSGKFAAEAGSSRATTSRLWPVSASTVAYDFIWWAPLFSRRGLWAVLLLFSLYGLLSELCRSCIRFLAWCIISLYTCKATRFRPGPAFMSACRYCVLWIGGRLFGQSQTDSSCEACSGRQAHRVFPHPSGWGCEIFFSDLSSFFSFFFFFSSSPPGSHLPIGDDGIHQYPSDSLPAHTFQLATTGSTSIPQTPSDSLRLPPTIGDSESPSVPQTPSHYWRFRIPQYPSDSLRRPPTIGDSESPSVPQTLSHYWRLRIPQCPSYSLPLLATQNPPVSLIISPTIGDSESPSVPQNPSHYWRLRIPQYPSESLIIIIIIIRIPPPPHHHQNPSSSSSSAPPSLLLLMMMMMWMMMMTMVVVVVMMMMMVMRGTDGAIPNRAGLEAQTCAARARRTSAMRRQRRRKPPIEGYRPSRTSKFRERSVHHHTSQIIYSELYPHPDYDDDDDDDGADDDDDEGFC